MPLRCRWSKWIGATVVAAALTVSGGPALTFQTTRFVDNTNKACSDTGTGTASVPFCTVAKAATVVVAGDTVQISGGPYVNMSGTTGVVTHFTRDGTSTNPIRWITTPNVMFAQRLDESLFTPAPGLANVYRQPWAQASGAFNQQKFAPILVDDPTHAGVYTMVETDGPLRLHTVTNDTDLVVQDGTVRINAGYVYVHPYGHRVPGPGQTEITAGMSGGATLTVDSGCAWNIFDGFKVQYTFSPGGTNNIFRNIWSQTSAFAITGSNNTAENIKVSHVGQRGERPPPETAPSPLWEFWYAGTGTAMTIAGTGHTIRNIETFHGWNVGVGNETTSGVVIDGLRSHGAPNHCFSLNSTNYTLRNAVIYNCQDILYTSDTTGLVLDHVTVYGGILIQSYQAVAGPITIRNSIFQGSLNYNSSVGPPTGCTYEVGTVIEYNVISNAATIDHCVGGVVVSTLPISTYMSQCAAKTITGCATIQNNILIDPATWNAVIAGGVWAQGDLSEPWEPAPVAGSPAINAAVTSTLATDINGVKRPIGAARDIGAYETTGATPATSPATDVVVAAQAAVTTTITAPTSGTTFNAGTTTTLTTLAGTAASARTVTACTWANSAGGAGVAVGTQSWTVPSIALTVGSNVVTVTCVNEGGTAGSDVLTVTRTSAPDLAAWWPALRRLAGQ